MTHTILPVVSIWSQEQKWELQSHDDVFALGNAHLIASSTLCVKSNNFHVYLFRNGYILFTPPKEQLAQRPALYTIEEYKCPISIILICMKMLYKV